MTATCRMLEIMKGKQKNGVSSKEVNIHLKRIGVVDKKGQITPKYAKILTEKK